MRCTLSRLFLVASLLILLNTTSFSQAATYQVSNVSFTASLPEQKEIREKLAADPIYGTLSSFEKEFIYYLNYARLYPAAFSANAVIAYLKSYPEFKPVYGDGLVKELSAAKASSLLFPDNKLVQLARSHATDVSAHDHMSHNSFNGTTMEGRFTAAGINCGSECINMLSSGRPLEVLLSLLVDYNVTNVGHRRSLLNPKMTFVGVAMGVSKKNLQYTIVDLGCY